MAEQYSLALNAKEVMEFVDEVFPQATVFGAKLDDLREGEATVCMQTNVSHLRPGNTVSGPVLFALADIGAYVLILAHIGKAALAVTTNVSINFLSKANPGELTAKTTFLKKGNKLIVCDVKISSQNVLIAQATVTYFVPPQK